jgi:hypothetical protein
MTEPKKAAHPLASVGGIAAAAGGWVSSEYCGASIWIPAIAVLLLVLLFTKTPFRPKFFVGAIAATMAHVIWFAIASVIIGAWGATGPDIIALSVGVIWLWLRPGLAAVIFLGLIQLASLAINVFSLAAATYGDAAHRALTAHCIFRLLAITCLIVGYIRLRRERSASIPVSSAAPIQ